MLLVLLLLVVLVLLVLLVLPVQGSLPRRSPSGRSGSTRKSCIPRAGALSSSRAARLPRARSFRV